MLYDSDVLIGTDVNLATYLVTCRTTISRFSLQNKDKVKCLGSKITGNSSTANRDYTGFKLNVFVRTVLNK